MHFRMIWIVTIFSTIVQKTEQYCLVFRIGDQKIEQNCLVFWSSKLIKSVLFSGKVFRKLNTFVQFFKQMFRKLNSFVQFFENRKLVKSVLFLVMFSENYTILFCFLNNFQKLINIV